MREGKLRQWYLLPGFQLLHRKPSHNRKIFCAYLHRSGWMPLNFPVAAFDLRIVLKNSNSYSVTFLSAKSRLIIINGFKCIIWHSQRKSSSTGFCVSPDESLSIYKPWTSAIKRNLNWTRTKFNLFLQTNERNSVCVLQRGFLLSSGPAPRLKRELCLFKQLFFSNKSRHLLLLALQGSDWRAIICGLCHFARSLYLPAIVRIKRKVGRADSASWYFELHRSYPRWLCQWHYHSSRRQQYKHLVDHWSSYFPFPRLEPQPEEWDHFVKIEPG